MAWMTWRQLYDSQRRGFWSEDSGSKVSPLQICKTVAHDRRRAACAARAGAAEPNSTPYYSLVTRLSCDLT
jgi:hypothetical protein